MLDPRSKRETLANTRGEALRGASYTEVYDGGVAVIDISGPIYRRANTMATSGAMSTEGVARDVRVARDSNVVKSIILAIDSPGGEATSMDELAQQIKQADSVKPVEAVIEGLGASAAYYIASPARRITASRMSLTGSIGVVMGVPIPAGKDKEGRNILKSADGEDIYVEFVSAQSPNKRLDPTTPEGMAHFQNIVDKTADVFLSDVGRFRNIDFETVAEKFGYGGIFVAGEARERGMIDEVGSFETVLDRLGSSEGADTPKGQSMTGASGKPPAQDAGQEARGEGDMSLLDRVQSMMGGKSQPPAQSDAKPTGPTTQAEFLAQYQERRQALEERFESDAILFAKELVDAQKEGIHAIQDHVAYEMLDAMVDDVLLGGTVLYPVRVGAEIVEREGTRQEKVRAKYEALPRTSLAGSRVKALQDGDIKGHALKEAPERSAKVIEPENAGVETFSDEELMKKTPAGQQALRERNGNNGTQSRAS